MSVDELIEAVKKLSSQERMEFHAWFTAFLAARRTPPSAESTDPARDPTEAS
jgi:hypothetical protein